MNRPIFDPPGILKSVSVDVRSELAPKIRAVYRRTEEDRRQLGVWLRECKEECLRRGENWLGWLEKETQIPERTASRWIKEAQNNGHGESTNGQVADGRHGESQNESEETGDDQPDDQTDVHLPALRPGSAYIVDGHSPRFGNCWAEIDPHPEHPGFWVYMFYFGIDEQWCFSESNGRGWRMDAERLAWLMAHIGFIPDGPWQETEPDPMPPAVLRYNEWFRNMLAESRARRERELREREPGDDDGDGDGDDDEAA